MQLALTMDSLVPLGAGAVVVLAVLIVLVVLLSRGRRRRRAVEARSAVSIPEPTASDWTGEAATGDPAPAPAPIPVQRVTVAEAVAEREAQTAPLPVSSETFLRRVTPTEAAAGVPEPTAAGEVPTQQNRTAEYTGWLEPEDGDVVSPGATGGSVDDAGPQTETAPEQVPDAGHAHGAVEHAPEQPAADSADSATGVPEAAAEAVGHPATDREPDAPPAPRPVPRPSGGPEGSSRTVAAAVAQALAVRAAAANRDQAREPSAEQPPPPAPRGDARDRLLAVLLDDPVRAVGAAMDLERCRGQVERLSDALRHEQGVLGDVLERLAGAGLHPEQLSRLSGLPLDEVRGLLARATPARTS